MQQPGNRNPIRQSVRRVWIANLAALVLAGCSPPSRPSTDALKPYQNIALKLRCADQSFADAIAPLARVWAAKTGAIVEVIASPLTPDDGADLAVLPASEIGFWADRGDLLSVPIALRESGHPYHWSGVLPAYRGEQMAGWGNQLVALPLAGDGYVVVYRADRFDDFAAAFLYQMLTDRELTAPTSWEEYSAIARFFAADYDGRPAQPKPSLPAFPTDPARAADSFFRVASCYDRPATGEAEQGKSNDDGAFPRDPLSFQFHADTGKPRLTSRGFQAAAEWLAGLRAGGALPAAGSPDDAAAALAEGRAVMAVLSLADLAKLPREGGQIPARFGIAPMPGTRAFANAKGDGMTGTDANYIPYCAGGRFGVVRKTCKQPEAAFDLLAEIGGPTRSLELLAAPGLGVGPFRITHADHPLGWLSYGFNDEGTKSLRAALGKYVRPEVRNRTYGLRGPEEKGLTLAVGQNVIAIASGTAKPGDALANASNVWDKIGSELPAGRLLQIRRRAVGLN